ELNTVVNELYNNYYSIAENIKMLYKMMNQLDFDEIEFESVNDLVNEINKMKGKYGETKEDVIIFLNEIQAKLDYINNFENIHKENIRKILDMERQLEEFHIRLTDIRKKYAVKLEKSIEKELAELEMKNARFSIQIDTIIEKNSQGFKKFNYDGNNIIEFYISTNKGSNLMPLRKIASGGEMSRIMLSLKTIIADKDNIETVIFDEIDSGISGETAKVASIKLNMLSNSKQVICITHSPQIIAKAKHHYVISKEDQDELTTADIVYLTSGEQRIFELAKIIDGKEVSNEGLLHAKEILNL
ncbi:MAG: DNA repair protein RecN, partial [Clostridia bacterium]|nr:DNA repair protein RecN [Clostridia bacterium]